MDSIQYCILYIIAGSILRIRRSIALGGTASHDGVPRRLSKLQAHLSRSTGIDDGLFGFADSDWGNSSCRRSTSGNLCLYNRSPVLRRSKLQKTTALSTAEAEYYSAATEVLYLRNLLERMGFAQPQPRWCDERLEGVQQQTNFRMFCTV
jgi:hypothetical protein